jgi:hypothetical protein
MTEKIASTGVGLFGNIKLKSIQIVKCVIYWSNIISHIKHKIQYHHQKIFIKATALIIHKNKLNISNHCFLGNRFWLRKNIQYSRHQTDMKSEIRTQISNNDIIYFKK